jgi:DNA polymerase I-like protein with 3'-5' exonuclease and polymerase domains
VKYSDIITIDFETKPIQDRPDYPPQPVGVAIKYGAEKSKYLAWGHAAGRNNATEEEAYHELAQIVGSDAGLLFHNAYFDLSVLHEYFGLALPEWSRVHDTAILAFLIDPHAITHGLKELAETHLGMRPEERDAIGEWAWEHRTRIKEETDLRVTRSKNKKTGEYKVSKVWQYYWMAPGDLAGEYACGDVDRTFELFRYWMPHVAKLGMVSAYNREREVAPIFYQNEVEGMCVNREALEQDCSVYSDLVEYVEDLLRERLGDSGLNFDADVDVAAALSRNGIVNDEDWSPTDSGEKWFAKNPGKTILDMPPQYRSMSKDKLKLKHYQDPEVFHVLGYRNRLQTALKMFMKPWRDQAAKTGGRIHTHWNTTRGASGGTRTGRPSTYSPNFLNISKNFEGRPDRWEHPDFIDGLDHLPLVRKYIIADSPDHVILHRDFSGQELRIFGHYECGPLLAAYKRDPEIDVHQMVADKILELFPGTPLNRGKTKIINFQSLYGGGANALAGDLDIDIAEAKQFKAYHNQALPGRVALVDTITRLTRRGIPIRTWGGRCYLPEPARRVDGQMRDFTYKLINYLIQGSAADITKQAMIDWHKHPDREARFLVQVYDELNVVAHKDVAQKQMEVLREVMQAPRIDVEMLSDGKIGYAWGELTKEKDYEWPTD